MSFPNVHKVLDNSEIHVPLDFHDAPNSSILTKNLNGDLEWRSQLSCWECPIIDFVDAEAAPPTTSAGDRYLIYAIAASTVDVGWGDAVVNDLVEYDIDTTRYISGTPSEGLTLYDEARDGYWFFDGENWNGRGFTFKVLVPTSEVLTLNSNPKLLAAAPLEGYALQCTQFTASIIFNSVAYDTNIAMLVKNSTAATSVPESQFTDTVLLPLSVDGVTRGDPAAGAIQIIKEDSLVLTVLTGNPANGNSDITVYGTYDIIKL